jgi:hypothetical protein
VRSDAKRSQKAKKPSMFDDDDDDAPLPPKKPASTPAPAAAAAKASAADLFGDAGPDDSIGPARARARTHAQAHTRARTHAGPLLKASQPVGGASVFSNLEGPAAGSSASSASPGALAAKAKAAAALFGGGDDDDDVLLPPKKPAATPAPAPTLAPTPTPTPTPAPAPAPARRPSGEEPTTPATAERRPCVPPVPRPPLPCAAKAAAGPRSVHAERLAYRHDRPARSHSESGLRWVGAWARACEWGRTEAAMVLAHVLF